MAKVEISTEDGCYSIPAEDLEKYRVEESQTEEEDSEVAGFMHSFDSSTLRPQSRVEARIGKRPWVRTQGRIVASLETVVSEYGGRQK